jgi:AbrB family looped-hinge helix DNA binding protein
VKRQARITSKGQITVPYEVRQAMGVQPGDKLEFEKNGADFVVRPVRTESPFAKYQGIGNPGIPRGRKAIICYFRKMRGHDDCD